MKKLFELAALHCLDVNIMYCSAQENAMRIGDIRVTIKSRINQFPEKVFYVTQEAIKYSEDKVFDIFVMDEFKQLIGL